jgi:restriction endonuclease Mrr
VTVRIFRECLCCSNSSNKNSASTSSVAPTVKNIEPKVVLIDGRQSAELMIDFNFGVDPVIAYEVKKITSDYFEEE